jgi:uncharacterized protein (TIGR04255 family)
MVAKGTPLPDRIEPDAIIEALFEVRFDMVSPLLEVLFSRLTEVTAWNGFAQRRLPAFDVPVQFREMDQNLRFVPVFELSGQNPPRAVRIGAHVLSYHRLQPYPGWREFSNEIEIAVDALFGKTQGLVVNRMGLRYINAFTPALHGIGSVSDLDLSVVVAQSRLPGNLNLNFTTDVAEHTQCTVRMATREFIQGQVPSDATLFVDIDVFTTSDFRIDTSDAVKGWLADAHTRKNEAFFGLMMPATLERLRRDM